MEMSLCSSAVAEGERRDHGKGKTKSLFVWAKAKSAGSQKVSLFSTAKGNYVTSSISTLPLLPTCTCAITKLSHVSDMPSTVERGFGFVSVGSKIYIVGGFSRFNPETQKTEPIRRTKGVYVADTSSSVPFRWKKLPSLKSEKGNPVVVVVGGKIYAMGTDGPIGKPWGEIFDPSKENEKEEWSAMEEPPFRTVKEPDTVYLQIMATRLHALTGLHAVDEDRILLEFRDICGRRLTFNHTNAEWNYDGIHPFPCAFDIRSRCITVANGILYAFLSGRLFAYDLHGSRPSQAIPIPGFKSFITKSISFPCTGYLFHLGQQDFCLIMPHNNVKATGVLNLFCQYFSISSSYQVAFGRHEHYVVEADCLIDCLLL